MTLIATPSYEELVAQVEQLESTVGTLMEVISKGSVEREELAMALANALSERENPESANWTQNVNVNIDSNEQIDNNQTGQYNSEVTADPNSMAKNGGGFRSSFDKYNISPSRHLDQNAITSIKFRTIKRFANYDKLDPSLRNYVLNLEIENKALKKEVDMLRSELKRRETDFEHMRIVLMKRVAHAEEAAQTYATKAASLEGELMAHKVKYQEAAVSLARAIGSGNVITSGPLVKTMSMPRYSISGENEFK